MWLGSPSTRTLFGWLTLRISWQAYIYTVDDTSASRHTSTNKGREALAYLTYIIDFYPKLPKVVVFMHPHEVGDHVDNQDHSNLQILQALRLDYVREQGFANVRCSTNPGCPAHFVIGQASSISEQTMRDSWTAIIGDFPPLPRVLASPGYSQFAVSKEAIRKRPANDYIRMRQWLLDTPLDDHVSSEIMEYLWHFIFGKEPVFCPDIGECFCRLFGACELSTEGT